MSNEPILIIDDHPLNLKLMKRLLEAEQYQVLSASNAEEALKILERFQPKLILMDFRMPEINGVELTRKIRSNPQNRDIVIVMVTSNDEKGEEQKARAAGCDGYITKPINVQTLAGLIADYLHKKKS